MVDRFQIQESCRNPKVDTGWTEDFCKQLDELAGEDHSWHMVGKSAIRGSVDDQSEQPGKRHSSNSIKADFPRSLVGFFFFDKIRRTQLKLDNNSAPLFDPIFKSDSVKGNSSSNINEVPTGHATTGPTDQDTSCTVNLVACFVDQGSSWSNWWQFSASWSSTSNYWWSTAGWQERWVRFSRILQNRLLTKAVSLKGWSIEHNYFFKFSFTSNSDSYVSDGWCKQHILYTQYFTACGSRLSRRFKTHRVNNECFILTVFIHSRASCLVRIRHCWVFHFSHSQVHFCLLLRFHSDHSPFDSTTSRTVGRLAIRSLLSWRRWRSTQITPRWSSFVKSEHDAERINSLLCR